MHHAGVLARVLPGADPRALAPLVHLDALPPRWLRRLAVLGGDTGALRLTKAEARDLTRLRDALGDMSAPAVQGLPSGRDLGADAVLARAASLESPLPADWQAEVARGAQRAFPIRAAGLAGAARRGAWATPERAGIPLDRVRFQRATRDDLLG